MSPVKLVKPGPVKDTLDYRTLTRFSDRSDRPELDRLGTALITSKMGYRAAVACLSEKIEAQWRAKYPKLRGRLRDADCLCALVGKRHAKQRDDDWETEECVPLPPYDDHGDAWFSGRRLMLYTYQPYEHVRIDEIYAYAKKFDFYVAVSPASWHFPTRTILVTITTREKWSLLHGGTSKSGEKSKPNGKQNGKLNGAGGKGVWSR